MRVSLIVAADENDTIGRDGGLPWHLPEDLKRFKATTTGHVVIAGRKTHDSIVGRLGHALPGRITIVVTRQPRRHDEEGVIYRPDVISALQTATERESRDEIFVIGGSQIYAAALPYVQRIYLTRVHDEVQGDTRMPDRWLEPFELMDSEKHAGYSFQTYDRR